MFTFDSNSCIIKIKESTMFKNIKNDMIWLLIGMAVLMGCVTHINEAISDDRIKIGIIDTGISSKQSQSKIFPIVGQ